MSRTRTKHLGLAAVVPALIVGVASVWAYQDIPASGRMARTLDPFLEEAFALGIVPGMAVAVVQGDEVVYLRGFGWADEETGRRITPDTVFYIASSSKSFTGTAAAILDERGELKLDAPLSVLMPGVQLHEGLSPEQITLRDLLTQTHGIENHGPVSFRSSWSGVQTHEMLMGFLQRHGPSASGRSFTYGNIAYNITSLVMYEALGKQWQDILAEEIFEPLGMRSTTAYVSRVPEDKLAMPYMLQPKGFKRLPYVKGDGNMHAGVSFLTTAADLTSWLRANLNQGRIGDKQILNASAIEETQRPQAEQENTFEQFKRTGYGLGWHTGTYDGDAFTHCFGSFSGFFCHISFMPQRGIGVVVLVNTSYTGMPISDIVSRYIYDRLREKPDTERRYRQELGQMKAISQQIRAAIAADVARRAARPQTLPRPLEAYAGAYENADLGRIDFSIVEGQKLEATMGRLWSAVEVWDNEQHLLRVELVGRGRGVQFEFEDGDRAVALRFMDERFDRVVSASAAPRKTYTATAHPPARAEPPAEEREMRIIELSDGEKELKETFNKEAGQVRLLLVLSPTCGGCLRGARVVQENVLEKIDSDRLSVQVVWTPVLASDSRGAVNRARRLITDGRATHFWDGDRSLGKTYGKIVELPGGRWLAWDIYFVFDGDAEWEEEPPKPADWAHQLGRDERHLGNGDKLRESIKELLKD